MAAQTKFNYVSLSKETKYMLSNYLDAHAAGEFRRTMYKAELENQINKTKKVRDPSSRRVPRQEVQQEE